MPRNNFLFQNAVYLLPYTGAGSGVVRAMETCPEAVFENKENIHEFIVTIPRESNQVSLESNQVEGKSNQVSPESNQVTIQDAQKVSKKSNQVKLTKKQIDILNFCSVPRSSQEIMDRLEITNQTKNRAHYIQSLLELGVLEMTEPDSPNSPTQKYRKKQ